MNEADWRAFALKQFLQTSLAVFVIFVFSVPFNALFYKLDCKDRNREGKNALAVALVWSSVLLLAGIFGAALGAHYIYVVKPPYFY